MKLVDSSIKNPVTVTVGVFFILLFGFIALFRIPVQLTPEIQEVEIQVETIWPGVGSELYRGLGSVVIGGLGVSTVFTLFLVPTLFSLVLDAKRAVGRLWR